MSAQVNLVAVKDGKILDSFVLNNVTIPEARQSFIPSGTISPAYNVQDVMKALKLCYSYHSKHSIPYSKYDARTKQTILSVAFDAYSKRISQAGDSLFSFSGMNIEQIVEAMETKLKYKDKTETIEYFNYVSDCFMVAAWMDFVERNQEMDFHIFIAEDMI